MLAKELYPGKFHPTVSHAFVALLAKKGLLRMLFTQNIDCLERRAGVPGDKIVEAHGSFATQRCIDCKTEFPDDEMRKHVEKGEPPHCGRPGCRGLVKPDIVFFGEQLPPVFYDRRDEPAKADLVLVLGTSLTVQPFASLPLLAGDGVPRVLFNKERVGDFGHRADDVLVLGDCDSGVRRLADALGWTRELEALWRGAVGDEEAERQITRLQRSQAEAKDEVDRLVQGVEEKLEISGHPADDGDANAGQVGAGGGAREPAAAAARHQAGEDDAAPVGPEATGRPEAAGRPDESPHGATSGTEGTGREDGRPERVADAQADLAGGHVPHGAGGLGDAEEPADRGTPTS